MPIIREFDNGVHPPEMKEQTEQRRIRRMPYPTELVLPLSQHFGAPAVCVVRAGDRVERGDVVAEADGFMSVPIHASATATVKEVGLFPTQDGSYSPAVHLEVEPNSAQVPRSRIIPDWHGLGKEELIAAVQQAGVVGLGGAAFPTHVKLSPPPDQKIDLLLLNGCECEPYLTSDHRTMAEYPDRVLLGVRIMMTCLGVDRALIGVEKNKPDAIEALERALPSDLDIEILPLRVRYPQGAEKMLIQALLDREVPSGKLPMHVGTVVQNVGSVAAIAEVFETGLPLIERIVTVTGRGVSKPGNLIVPVGTKLRDLFDACGGLRDDTEKIVAGGPMMGPAVASLDAPVLKGTTGVVALTKEECRPRHVYPCIRCGHCLDACPVFLNPQAMGSLARKREFETLEKSYHLRDCMLCGCCSYVCPSNIPLSQLFKVARTALQRERARS